MSDTDDTGDHLLAELQSAVEARIPVSSEMVDMIMAGYDITNLDAVTAELVGEDRAGDLAAVRDTEGATRLLMFRSDSLSFEFELGKTAPQVVGHVDPPSSGTLHLEQSDTTVTAVLDDLGRFEFSLPSSKPFRLRYESANGNSIATDWVLP